jgi:hypothetical protein
MASWFWLNVPLMAVFFLATAGIPVWLVLRRPDWSGGENQASAAAEAGTNPPASWSRTLTAPRFRAWRARLSGGRRRLTVIAR